MTHEPPVRAAVVTCSDSVAAGRHPDESGALAVAGLRALGFAAGDPLAVPDDKAAIAAAVSRAIDKGARIVVTDGGTGLGPRDVTIEALESPRAVPLPGIGEAIRAITRGRVPNADLSRSGGFRLRDALVLCLPGSPGAVTDGMRVAGPLLAHAVAMIDGQGHAGLHSAAHSPGARTVPAAGHTPGAATPAAGHTRIAVPAVAGPFLPDTPAAPEPRASVTDRPLDVAALRARVGDDAAGAILVFEGRVRSSDRDRAVLDLTYESHPDAEKVLADIVAQAVGRPSVTAAAAAHRTGQLKIGELAFAAAVSAPHRREAFEALWWLVDEAKSALPIWKLQRFADGSSEWVNSP